MIPFTKGVYIKKAIISLLIHVSPNSCIMGPHSFPEKKDTCHLLVMIELSTCSHLSPYFQLEPAALR
jgi:hypothetical protein